MKRSSLAQLELDWSGGTSAQDSVDFNGLALADAVTKRDAASDAASSGASLRVPNFGSYSEKEMFALTSRMAGRVNAASMSDEEHAELLRERQVLLDKELAGTISRQEANRLTYVRWSLDRVEDAKYGQVLDVLEGYVNKYEQFLYDIRNLQEQLWQRTRRKK